MIRKIFNALPSFKGKYRLARAFFSSAIKHKKDLMVKGKHGIHYRLPNLKENIGFEIFVNGIYETEYISYFCRHIPRNGVFLDLGANIGSICIPISKLRPDIKIVAVEASPRVFSYLKANIEWNSCKNIFIENMALSASDNEMVSFYSPEEKFGKGSLSAVYTDKAEHVTSIKVDTLVKKYNLEKVDFVKIDVEGYESLVFKGAENLLNSRAAPSILFEFADWAEELAKDIKPGDSQAFLHDRGYKLYDFGKPDRPVPIPKPKTAGNLMIMASKELS